MNSFENILPSVIKSLRPRWGIVLGSGLGGISERAEPLDCIPYADVPGLPASKVPGHSGQFVVAKLAGKPVVLAQGRVHLYEGYRASEVTAGIRFLAACGVERIVLTNSAGSLNAKFPPGEWMMINDHLNFTGTSPLLGDAHFIDMTDIYGARLRRHFQRSAEATNIPLHEGVYAGVLGPQYETPAEIRMLRHVGADAVGMSTVLEAIQARALGLELAGFSCLTNWAAGISVEPLSHADVLQTGAASSGDFCDLIEHALESWRS